MTREEQIRILTDAQERAFKQIDQTKGCEMGSEEFSRLVSVANQLSWEIRDQVFPAEVEVAGAPEQVQPEPAEPETAPEEVQPEPKQNLMSKEDVRDKLSTYSNKYDHLDVAAIMSEMGYSKLSEIPATRYAELLEKVETAVKEGV